MEENKYLNEEQYQKNNAKVKKIGKVLLICGAIVLVLGLVSIVLGFFNMKTTSVESFNSLNDSNFEDASNIVGGFFGSFGLFALGGFLDFVGTALLMVGGILMLVSHKREITAYTTQQAMPVVKETVNDVTPTVANAAGSIAKEVSKGIAEGKEEAKKKED